MARAAWVGAVIVLATGSSLTAQDLAVPVASHETGAPDRALIDRYCVTCHNDRARTGGLSLADKDLAQVGDAAGVWEAVVRKLNGGMMPPLGMPKPEPPALQSFTRSLEVALNRAGRANPDPGRASIHRLNRSEYANAVRDLLDLDVDVAELLPADDESYGFDNIADVLRVSPSLLEQYLVASYKVSALAVGDLETAPISQVYRIPPDRAQGTHGEGLPLGTRGGLVFHHNFPLDAEYQFSVKLLRNIVGYLTGLEFAHELEIAIDGERVFLAPVGGEEDNRLSDLNMSEHADRIDERLKAQVPVSAGPHAVSVAFIRKNSAESDEPLQPFTRDHDLQNMNGIPIIDYVDLRGPFQVTGAGDTPSRRRIFTCHPRRNEANGAEAARACAETILEALAHRAYRGLATDEDLETLLTFFDAGYRDGGFESGVQLALRLILASPKFIFRSELEPAPVAPGELYRIHDLELASRLSFFLWSSIPDDELLTLAAEGRLSEEPVLRAQVRRMLDDARAQALVDNFAGQWLFLRNLQSARPDNQQFPNFDDNLRQAFRRETELFFESIMREDRSLVELLTADYTFVNGRLAEHYGIPNVYGSRFRRVHLDDPNRRGLLGQGSILTVTSYPNRTSPVLRGKWILENILGTPPPPPLPNVPALEESQVPGEKISIRAMLELHRKNPVCATCHAVMDPLGFALENFNAVGKWRSREEGGAVDASGQLANGTPVDGPAALRQALTDHPERFVGTVTEKLLTYALGRGLESFDMPVVRGIVEEAAQDDYRFSAVVLGIVQSTPFVMRKAPEVPTPGPSADAGGLPEPGAVSD